MTTLPFGRYPALEGSDPDLLARIGSAVRARLDSAPSASRMPAQHLGMYIVRRFMSGEECAEMIALIDAGAKPSPMLSASRDTTIRTSQTCKLPPCDAVIRAERRIASLLGLPLAHGETLQGQRYRPGEYFRMHNDYFAGAEPYSEVVAAEGGQRTWTAMVFLNEPKQGGCTSFPYAGIDVPPQTGSLLVWNNIDEEGLGNPYAHHQGLPVEAGTKYILTKWFREREWRATPQSDAARY
jgi:prolyl 4-hydroxylase